MNLSASLVVIGTLLVGPMAFPEVPSVCPDYYGDYDCPTSYSPTGSVQIRLWQDGCRRVWSLLPKTYYGSDYDIDLTTDYFNYSRSPDNGQTWRSFFSVYYSEGMLSTQAWYQEINQKEESTYTTLSLDQKKNLVITNWTDTTFYNYCIGSECNGNHFEHGEKTSVTCVRK